MFTVENARLKSAYFAKKKQISKNFIIATSKSHHPTETNKFRRKKIKK
jgi:hypothetical protein